MSLFSLNKSSSLKNTSEIDAVFKNGKKISSKLISLYYIKPEKDGLMRIAFTVGKKTHNLATTRNKLKRLMKESFRINAKQHLRSDLSYNLVFVYFSSKQESFKKVEESMKSLLLSFKSKILS